MPVSSDPKYPVWHDIQAAAARLRTHLAVTPLRSYRSLDEAIGLHVLVKHENHRPTNSFKMRSEDTLGRGMGGTI